MVSLLNMILDKMYFPISECASIFLSFCFRSHLKKPTATNQADPLSGSMRRDCWGQKASSWGQTPLPLDTQQQRNSHVITLPPITQHNRIYCTFTKAYVGPHTYSIIIKHGHPGYLGYMITDVSGCRMDGDEEAGESPWQPTSQRMAQPCGDCGVRWLQMAWRCPGAGFAVEFSDGHGR